MVSSETSYLACATILLQIQEHVRILPVVDIRSPGGSYCTLGSD